MTKTKEDISSEDLFSWLEVLAEWEMDPTDSPPPAIPKKVSKILVENEYAKKVIKKMRDALGSYDFPYLIITHFGMLTYVSMLDTSPIGAD